MVRIERYKLLCRGGRYAWYWAYTVVGPNGERSNRGRQPLASIRSWAKRTWPGSPVVETWKQAQR